MVHGARDVVTDLLIVTGRFACNIQFSCVRAVLPSPLPAWLLVKFYSG